MKRLKTDRSFFLILFLCIITLGFYAFYLIYAFAQETNIACREDGKKTQGLVVYILLSILTLGIYPIVWECMWITRCNNYLARHNENEGLQVSTFLLTLFILGPLTLGIMYFVVGYKQISLQNRVNLLHNELNTNNKNI